MDKTQKRWIYLSLGISAVILAVMVGSTFNEETLEYLTHMNIFFLILAIGLRFLSFTIWALRIQKMSLSLGYSVPFPHCLNLVVANLLVGALTPGQAGGEPVRIHELYKARMTLGDATAVVIMERVLDAVMLVLLSVVSILVMGSIIWSLSSGIIFVIFLSLFLLILFVLLLLYAVRYPDPAKRLVMKFLHWVEIKMKRPSIQKIISSTDVEFDNFCSGINAFASHGKAGFIWGSVYTILFWFSEFVVASVILMGLGLPPSISESILAQVIIALVSMIPLTPGASGIAELSAASLYALFVPTAALGIFILLWRLIMFYLNIVFGFIATMFIFKREISSE